MSLLLAIDGSLAVLFFIWSICRTQPGDKAEAEAVQANITAQKAQMEAIFGDKGDS